MSGEITVFKTYYPKAGEKLAKPILDVSTKLEELDRYLTWKEAKKIAGLADSEAAAVNLQEHSRFESS